MKKQKQIEVPTDEDTILVIKGIFPNETVQNFKEEWEKASRPGQGKLLVCSTEEAEISFINIKQNSN